MKGKLLTTACLVVAFLVTLSCQQSDTDGVFNISGTTFDGADYVLADTIGRPAVVNFWFPSCPPCTVELPDFRDAHSEYGDRVEFLGVFNPSVDSLEQAKSLLDEIGITYPNVTDTNGTFAFEYSVSFSPTTFFISSDHATVRRYEGGPIPYETLVANIEALLN